jgi:hypothetical protein
VEKIAPKLLEISQHHAVMNYQRVLKRLAEPEKDFIREAQEYTRKYKRLLLKEPETRKMYFSGLLLCTSYPLWAAIFRRGLK